MAELTGKYPDAQMGAKTTIYANEREMVKAISEAPDSGRIEGLLGELAHRLVVLEQTVNGLSVKLSPVLLREEKTQDDEIAQMPVAMPEQLSPIGCELLRASEQVLRIRWAVEAISSRVDL